MYRGKQRLSTILGSVLSNWIFRSMFHYDLHDGSTGRYQRDVQEMFVIRWHFEIVLPNSLFRIPFFTFSQSKHVFNLFNSHVSFNKKVLLGC